MKAPSAALERFALKAHHYGRISGVSLAAHAIPDAFLILHTGVGCKYKGAAQISQQLQIPKGIPNRVAAFDALNVQKLYIGLRASAALTQDGKLYLFAYFEYTGDDRSLRACYPDLQAKTLCALAREDGLISVETGLLTQEVLDSVYIDRPRDLDSQLVVTGSYAQAFTVTDVSPAAMAIG